MTRAFIVNRRAAIFRVLLYLAITFTLGFAAGRVSASSPAAKAIPATSSGSRGESNTLTAERAAHSRFLLDAERSVPVILGGGAVRTPVVNPSNEGAAGSTPVSVGHRFISGTATWGYFSGHVVTRYPRGTRIRVCGALGCWSGRSWGYGPAVWTGHIADLDRAVFARICGAPSRGIAPITLEVRR